MGVNKSGQCPPVHSNLAVPGSGQRIREPPVSFGGRCPSRLSSIVVGVQCSHCEDSCPCAAPSPNCLVTPLGQTTLPSHFGRSLPTGLHRQPEPAVQPTAPTRQVTSRHTATKPNSSKAARRTATREITASQHSAYRPRNSMENQRPWRTATAASGRARWLAQVQDAWVHSNHRLANQRSPRFLSMMRRHSWHNGSGYSDDPRFVAS